MYRFCGKICPGYLSGISDTVSYTTYPGSPVFDIPVAYLTNQIFTNGHQYTRPLLLAVVVGSVVAMCVCVFCFDPRCFGIAIQSRSVGKLSERVRPLGVYVSVVEDRRIAIEYLSVSIVLELFSLPHQDQCSRVNTKLKLNQTDVFVRDQPNCTCTFQRLHSVFGERKSSKI